MLRYNVSLTQDIANQLRKICENEGRNFSDVIREAIAFFLKNRDLK